MKMELKNWPSWLKGGILGVILIILFVVIAYIIFMLFEISIQDFPPFSQINEFVDRQCGLLTQCRGQGYLVCILWDPILMLGESFFLGALIGWIYNKIKTKNESAENSGDKYRNK